MVCWKSKVMMHVLIFHNKTATIDIIGNVIITFMTPSKDYYSCFSIDVFLSEAVRTYYRKIVCFVCLQLEASTRLSLSISYISRITVHDYM
ncbi:unnamed protein product [Auanema sp. JU1783]|nr:unnamed protein product [Auanema sp. JU1783]